MYKYPKLHYEIMYMQYITSLVTSIVVDYVNSKVFGEKIKHYTLWNDNWYQRHDTLFCDLK